MGEIVNAKNEITGKINITYTHLLKATTNIISTNPYSLIDYVDVVRISENNVYISNTPDNFIYAVNLAKLYNLPIRHIDPLDLSSNNELETCSKITSLYKDMHQINGILIIKNVDLLVGYISDNVMYRKLILVIIMMLKEDKIRIIVTSETIDLYHLYFEKYMRLY